MSQESSNSNNYLAVRVRIPPEACEKVASDLGLGSGFHRIFRFPPPVTNG